MTLNVSSPDTHRVSPVRSPRSSYLFWLGATSASTLGILSLYALMAEQAGATPVILPSEGASASVVVPPTALQDRAIATDSAPPTIALVPSAKIPLTGVKPAPLTSTILQPSPILPSGKLDALQPILIAQEATAPASQPDSSNRLSPFAPDELDSVAIAIHAPVSITPTTALVAQSPLEEPSQESVTEPEEPAVTPIEEPEEPATEIVPPVSTRANDLGGPLIRAQGAVILDGDDFSARARLTGSYALSPNVMVGATVDLTTGDAFSDSREDSFNLNELYVSVIPDFAPTFRVVAGLMDLTSYFDRNSFAKDSLTHFFNPVFQTNPALAAAGIGSRPGLLVNWTPVDTLDVKVAAFSSDRDLGNFDLDAVAGEVGVRVDNFILRGTFSSNTDSGEEDGFQEIFQFDRGDDQFGLRSGDREDAFALNAELFIPSLNVGLFGRYGWYENRSLDQGGQTFSLGFNVLDLFLPDDRLGLAYGQQLSNRELRDDDDKTPDVVELFYDIRLTSFLRAGASLQARDEFSETVLGFRIRADFDLTGPRGIFR